MRCFRNRRVETIGLPLEAGATLREALERNLSELLALPPQELRDQRYRKFRAMGRFIDPNSSNADPAS